MTQITLWLWKHMAIQITWLVVQKMASNQVITAKFVSKTNWDTFQTFNI